MIYGKEQFERDFKAFLNEDDSQLAALYHKLPRPEPDAKLDAAVVAMARRTLNPHVVATPPGNVAVRQRVRWLAPLGATAGLVLAAGVALRVGPQIWSTHNEPAPTAIRDNGMIQVRPAREAAAEIVQQPAAAPAAEIPTDRADVDAKELKKVENAASRPAAPWVLPDQARREPEMDAAGRKQAIATGVWQKLHENDSAGTVLKNTSAILALDAAAAPAAATRAKSVAVPANATTTALQAVAPAEQEKRGEVQQPGYSAELIRNSRLYPESWIAVIQQLVRDGRRDEAMQNLKLFRKKYPAYHLPADLEHPPATPK